ncbi:hypothetical protein PES01_29700 [Pseudoalteromonas espejiana]|uniref:Uncharacterized protein n=1 Tax=Pseudoalteromonas espejiana TaxID=28107 RepID=A0A510XYK3_9GAMM|nr:hypothetical protein PES01_29700 [Pseudoalteromonas espejiana]
MAVSAAGSVRPCKNRTKSNSLKLGASVNNRQLRPKKIIAIRSIFNGLRLAKNNPYKKGAIAKGNIVAVIKLPATAGNTLNSRANKLSKGCGAYSTKNINTEQISR